MKKNEMMKALEQYKMESGFYSIERILIDNGWNPIDARFAAILKSYEDESRKEAISKWPELAQLAEIENQKLHEIAKQNEPVMEAVNLIMVDDETGEEYTVASQRPKQAEAGPVDGYDGNVEFPYEPQIVMAALNARESAKYDMWEDHLNMVWECADVDVRQPEAEQKAIRRAAIENEKRLLEIGNEVFALGWRIHSTDRYTHSQHRIPDEALIWNVVSAGHIATAEAQRVEYVTNTLLQSMTAAEVAEKYGLSESAVRKTISRKQIEARKSGGTWLIRRADAETRWGGKSQGGSSG